MEGDGISGHGVVGWVSVTTSTTISVTGRVLLGLVAFMACVGSIDGTVMLSEPRTTAFIVVIDVMLAVATVADPDTKVLASSERKTK